MFVSRESDVGGLSELSVLELTDLYRIEFAQIKLEVQYLLPISRCLENLCSV